MADYPAPQSAPGSSTAPITAGVLAYALFAIAAITSIASSGLPFIAPVFGVLGIIAVIVCYVKRDDAAGTWVASHFTWLIRTFWWSLLWAVIGVLLMIVVVGFAILVADAIWFLYRVIKGWLRLSEGKPMSEAAAQTR